MSNKQSMTNAVGPSTGNTKPENFEHPDDLITRRWLVMDAEFDLGMALDDLLSLRFPGRVGFPDEKVTEWWLESPAHSIYVTAGLATVREFAEQMLPAVIDDVKAQLANLSLDPHGEWHVIYDFSCDAADSERSRVEDGISFGVTVEVFPGVLRLLPAPAA